MSEDDEILTDLLTWPGRAAAWRVKAGLRTCGPADVAFLERLLADGRLAEPWRRVLVRRRIAEIEAAEKAKIEHPTRKAQV